MSGIVKAVSAEKKSITIGDQTFDVAPDASIALDYKQSTLAEVPVGANVNVALHVDRKTVGRLQASGRSVFASVKAVDTEKNTITVAGSDDDGKTFSVAPDTVITIDGKPGKLAGIPAGASLHALNLRVDQKTAGSINAYGPGYHNVPVKSVDAEKRTITLEDKAPAVLAGKTFPVVEDANIEIDGKRGQLSGIPAGAFVGLGLSVDKQTVTSLQATGPSLGGCGGSMVKAVSIGTDTITFDDKALAEVAGKSFTVAKDAYVVIDGKPGKLAEVPVGAFVNLTLSVDRQTARQVHAQGARLSGVVKAVDAEKKTINVDDKTFTVASHAIIVIDGNKGTLAALRTGVNVNLSLHVDQKTVGMIQTNGK
jgi:hypothetical protein